MLFRFNRSIQNQLIIIIAGVSIIAAITSTIGHYIFTEKIINNSIDQQMQSTLLLTSDYLKNNYSKKLQYDLTLLNSSREVDAFISSRIDEYFIRQLDVEKLFLSFAKSREELYHSIRLIEVSGSELAVIEKNEGYVISTQSP